jgi:uncharacterized protein YggE
MPSVHSALFRDILKLSITFFVCLLLFFLTLFVYTKAAGPLPFRVDSVTTQKTDSFLVTGTGKSSIKPDKGTVRLGVNATGKTADEAKSKMNEVINKVNASIKGLGIEAADIKTENFSVYPNRDDVIKPMVMEAPDDSRTTIAPAPPATSTPPDPDEKATSYTANTTLVITVRQVDLANKVIDTASSQGANQMGGVQFDNTDTTAAENDARTKAIADAKQKAQTAAQAAGFTLGKLMNYQENSGGNVIYDKAMPMAVSGRAESEPTQIEPGQNEVSMTVTLSYEVL